jgi:hypothetical protein
VATSSLVRKNYDHIQSSGYGPKWEIPSKFNLKKSPKDELTEQKGRKKKTINFL